MTVRDYVLLLRKRWLLIMLCLAASVGAAAAVTLSATSQYSASIKMFISSQEPGQDVANAYQGGLFSQQRVKSYADLLSGPSIVQAVRGDLQPPERAGAVHLSASAVPDTNLLTATATDPVPARARDIANAAGKNFARLVTELERPEGGGPSLVKVTIVEGAKLPTSPVSPNKIRNLALALVLGALLGVGLAVLRETLDTSVKSPEDVTGTAEGLVTLGAIGFDPEAAKRPLIRPTEMNSRRSEALRQLRTNLQFVDVAAHPKSIVVTSSLPNEGKSTTACNLAITLAQAGAKVVLVEADLRRPRLMTYLGIEGAVGLTSVLIQRATLEEAVQSWGEGLLDVLPSGPVPPNPSELLGSKGMNDLVARLEAQYDMVLLDTPPLLPVTDAAVLSVLADGALLVVRSNKTRREQLRRAVEALQAVDARLLGVVLNMVPTRGARAYHYGYGYGYGYAATPAAATGWRGKRGPRVPLLGGLLRRRTKPAAAPERAEAPVAATTNGERDTATTTEQPRLRPHQGQAPPVADDQPVGKVARSPGR